MQQNQQNLLKQIEIKCMGAIEKDKNGKFSEAFTEYAEVISSVGSVLKSNGLKSNLNFSFSFLKFLICRKKNEKKIKLFLKIQINS